MITFQYFILYQILYVNIPNDRTLVMHSVKFNCGEISEQRVDGRQHDHGVVDVSISLYRTTEVRKTQIVVFIHFFVTFPFVKCSVRHWNRTINFSPWRYIVKWRRKRIGRTDRLIISKYLRSCTMNEGGNKRGFWLRDLFLIWILNISFLSHDRRKDVRWKMQRWKDKVRSTNIEQPPHWCLWNQRTDTVLT